MPAPSCPMMPVVDIQELYFDVDARFSMGNNGRRIVVDEYSVEKISALWQHLITKHV